MSDSKLQEARATTEKLLKELKAEVDNNPSDPQALINRVIDYMHSMAGRMGYLEDTITNHITDYGKHLEGHLPPVKGREQMSKALKGLGLGEEYEPAAKKVVYANTKNGPVAFIGKDVEI